MESPITAQATTSGAAEVPSISPDGTRIAFVTKRCDATGRCLFDLMVQDIGGAGTLTVASGAKLLANATAKGNGGNVIVWSDGKTSVAGSLEAKGGAAGGNGG